MSGQQAQLNSAPTAQMFVAATTGVVPSDARITEDGQARITEDGQTRIIE